MTATPDRVQRVLEMATDIVMEHLSRGGAMTPEFTEAAVLAAAYVDDLVWSDEDETPEQTTGTRWHERN